MELPLFILSIFTKKNCSIKSKRTDTILIACDHDFTKLSLTPSVIFFIDIPTDITESFYSGNVTVSYKDTLFQPSKALRHSTEFLTAIKNQYLNKTLPPILCLFTDGGG